ncbi:MAG: RHS repeat-associated core domain-containing protein [Planctomycetia bacterium]|nr:MAG: RHS repeat-associated core domain-containing protein [Planctomycetia bacterium]
MVTLLCPVCIRAGGIGGLLAVLDTNNTTTTSDDCSFAYCYDANGNVGQLVEWATDAGGASGMAWAAGRMAATYEYDPYGNTVSKSGTYSDTNSFRFSTRFLDAETGLYYYGYRYYSPRLGRWISRDPINEQGGTHLYAYVRGAPTLRSDPIGLDDWCASECKCGEKMCQIEIILSFVRPDADRIYNDATGAVLAAENAIDVLGAKSLGGACKVGWGVSGLPGPSQGVQRCGSVVLRYVEENAPHYWVWARAWNKECQSRSCWLFWSVCKWGEDVPTEWTMVPRTIVKEWIFDKHQCLSEEVLKEILEWAQHAMCK